MRFRTAAFLPVLLPATLSALLLTGCAEYPDLGSAVSRQALAAPYPRLLPLDPLLRAAAQTSITPATGAGLTAEADRLEAKADRLRAAGPADTARTKARAEALRRRVGAEIADTPSADSSADSARIDALRQRAGALTGDPVLSDADRARLLRATQAPAS